MKVASCWPSWRKTPKTVRMFHRSILEAAGFSVAEAMNGVEALERAMSSDRAPDLFLVDVNMPVMDGYTFLRRIRREPTLLASSAAM